MKKQVTGVWQLKYRCTHCKSMEVYPSFPSMTVCPVCGIREARTELVVARSVNTVHWFRRPTFSHWEIKESEAK